MSLFLLLNSVMKDTLSLNFEFFCFFGLFVYLFIYLKLLFCFVKDNGFQVQTCILKTMDD